PGLDFINQLRPVTYTLDAEGIQRTIDNTAQLPPAEAIKGLDRTQMDKIQQQEKAKVIYTGFVAQEVEQAAKKMNYDFSGVDAPKDKEGFYGLRYVEFVVPLVKAVQELSAENSQLKEENKQLREEMQQKMARLEELVNKFSN